MDRAGASDRGAMLRQTASSSAAASAVRSAGANVAAAVTLADAERGRNHRPEGPEGGRDRGHERAAGPALPPIAFQLLVYPITDHRLDSDSLRAFGGGRYFLTETHLRWYWEQYLGPGGDGSHPWASPLRAEREVLSGVPAACIVTAELDPLRDEGEAYARALAQAGVTVELQRAAGMFRGFFAQGDLLSAAAEPTRQALSALRKAFHQ